ncbi:MAG: tRNA-guanine transglycosylase, partial [Clostridia bacterium]|nr:tRNA-guanine transglycosylase [Clostridia bacterium]
TSRNARHANLFTDIGVLNLNNKKFEKDERPLQEGCQCPACKNYSRGYIRHLIKAKEMLGMRLCVLHNLYFYNDLMEKIRTAIEENRFAAFKAEALEKMNNRV